MKEKLVIIWTSKPSEAASPEIGARPASKAGARPAPRRAKRPAIQLHIEVDEVERSRISALRARRGVAAVAPVMPIKLIRPFPASSEEPSTVQGMSWGIQATGADQSPFSGKGAVVAVLDTGIDSSHSAFRGVQVVEKDFTGDGNGDRDGHGTHCAGTILGRDTDNTRIGIARGVKKALIGKVIGREGGSSDWICAAISWASEAGAHVLSMSLGIDFPGYVATLVNERQFPVELATSKALEEYRANVLLFETLARNLLARAPFFQPALLVAAAGNESRRDENPDWEIAVSPPAVSEGILSVAALAKKGASLGVAPFSNTGADLAAPGVNILSAKAGGGLLALSGTSMATPHVAGVAALWVEKLVQNGRLDPEELAARVIGTATKKGLPAGTDSFDVGAGLVQAPREE